MFLTRCSCEEYLPTGHFQHSFVIDLILNLFGCSVGRQFLTLNINYVLRVNVVSNVYRMVKTFRYVFFYAFITNLPMEDVSN